MRILNKFSRKSYYYIFSSTRPSCWVLKKTQLLRTWLNILTDYFMMELDLLINKIYYTLPYANDSSLNISIFDSFDWSWCLLMFHAVLLMTMANFVTLFTSTLLDGDLVSLAERWGAHFLFPCCWCEVPMLLGLF